jgi:ATP-dependent DNA helicase RecG
LELVWFQGISWVQKAIQEGHQYIVFGRLSFFMGSPQISHPDVEPIQNKKPLEKISLSPFTLQQKNSRPRGLNGAALAKIHFGIMPKNSPERSAREPACKYPAAIQADVPL